MAILIERTETKKEIKIIYKRYPLFYILIVSILVAILIQKIPFAQEIMLIISSFAFYLIFMLFILFYIVYAIEALPKIKEVKEAMKNGKVLISGNKFSFKNPFIYTIVKSGKKL